MPEPRTVSFTLNPVTPRRYSGNRRGEPVRLGVPLPRGVVDRTAQIQLATTDGRPLPVQARALDAWPDGSIRWALLDFRIDCPAGSSPPPLVVYAGGDAAPAQPTAAVVVEERDGQFRITTGSTAFEIQLGGPFPLTGASVEGRQMLDEARSGLAVTIDGRRIGWTVSDVTVVEAGPLRAELAVGARHDGGSDLPLEAFATVEIFAGTPVVRLSLTLRNRRRAVHPGGRWPLGDPGSVLLDAADLTIGLKSTVRGLHMSLDPDATPTPIEMPVDLLQASSGGPNWNARTHVNRDGKVTLPFCGYRLRAGTREETGGRATPTFALETDAGPAAVAVPAFWENFPRSIRVDADELVVGLFPAGAGDLHELQGGEQKTHTVVLAIGRDAVTESPLAWCHDPILFVPDAVHVARTGAIPGLPVTDTPPRDDYIALVDTGLDAALGFFAKREQADEYGWRHFGDMPADHESAFQPPDRPFVSHYNNQYDPIAGFALQFLRTGDARWWALMDDLARHVRDIDVYHTSEDKAAYNGGLFWHTNHYVDAGTSTHRTYPKDGAAGGGPSAEHNYNLGLMLHHCLTGDRLSKDTAVGLGQWVIDMDDGRLTPFRWLSRADTGLASRTFNHQRPGRGAGHSILACLVAHRLTDDDRYLRKAEAIIARCIHPDEAIPTVYVENIEACWSYTAFLQSLGFYVEHKLERGERDAACSHALRSLRAFADWMTVHERPYFERRELLEYPTETWVAQDLRKADVFYWAARFSGGDDRARFVAHAHRFFDYAMGTLPTMKGYWYSRPLTLVMTQGLRAAVLATDATWLPPAPAVEAVALPPRRPFREQRAIAVRRAALIAAAGLIALLASAGWLLASSL